MFLPLSENPVLAVSGSDPKYKNDHLRHFFETEVYNNILSLTPAEKDRYFKFQRDYEPILKKIYGDLNNVMHKATFLPSALQAGIDDPLVKEYKEWLDKQNG